MNGMDQTLLIVGGYGTFGGRLVELLEDEKDLTLIVSGRSLHKAEAFCDGRGETKAQLVAAYFDRNGDLSKQISSLKPDTIIDASGPFQDYGEDGYKLIEACIHEKVNYLDLADGTAFVEGVSRFDEDARKADIYVLSGVSSFPVLTALVVKALSSDIPTLNTIKGGIAPSPYAGVGENVIRAIAGYAGQYTSIKKDGQTIPGYPLTSTMRYTIAPPGYTPLKNTLFSLVDVPDLKVLPKIFPDVQTVWMGAGPVPAILHRCLIGLSWLVRWKIIPTLSPLARLMQYVMAHVRWGEHRGGMFVEIEGLDSNNTKTSKSWHLLAEGRDGPLIPCMAVEAIIKKILQGDTIPTGARTAINDVTLDDYNRLFSKRTIYTGFRDENPQTHLYGRILGESWDKLPLEIQKMHAHEGNSEVRGLARVTRGTGHLANLVANIIGFPKAGTDIPVHVKFTRQNGKEKWTRTFAEHPFSSLQYEGRGRSKGFLMERFGPLTFAIALVPEQDNILRLVVREWRVLGLKLPLWLAPRSSSYEQMKDGKFTFYVDISHPITGKIVTYTGWLRNEG